MIAVATLSARPMEKCCDSRTMHTIHGKCLNKLQALVFLMPTLAQVTNKIGGNKQDKTTALKKHREGEIPVAKVKIHVVGEMHHIDRWCDEALHFLTKRRFGDST